MFNNIFCRRLFYIYIHVYIYIYICICVCVCVCVWCYFSDNFERIAPILTFFTFVRRDWISWLFSYKKKRLKSTRVKLVNLSVVFLTSNFRKNRVIITNFFTGWFKKKMIKILRWGKEVCNDMKLHRNRWLRMIS